MEAQRAWEWNFKEMRNADLMDSQQAAQGLTYPLISGFTPVNSTEAQGFATTSMNDHPASTSKIEGKAKASKRRKAQTFATPKPRKAAGTRKPNKRKTAGELQCQDISRGLSRIKPAPSGNHAPLVKTAAPSELVVSQPRHVTNLVHDTWADLEHRGDIGPAEIASRPSGLADKYQLAYAKQLDADILPKPAIDGAETDPSTGHELLHDGVDEFEDFLVPTSAQGDKHVDIDHNCLTKEGLIPFAMVTEKAFDSDEIFGDQDEADEFPMNDEGLEEFMQSITPTGVHDAGALPDWQPQHFNDDPLVFGDSEEQVQSVGTMQDLSDPVSIANNAKLRIYQDKKDRFDDDEIDEELVVALSNRHAPGFPDIQSEVDYAKDPEYRNSSAEDTYHDRFVLSDGPIPATPYSSINQSSRILSHVSGNITKVGADRAQRHVLEGEHDSFDDDELDEALVDLTGNDSDSLQPQTPLTSPGQPPSSPKLKWMPSKTYIPINSSQVQIHSSDLPHKVPVDGEHLPFMRPPFPKPIQDRSPVIGLTNHTVLRTCFRIGEALNAAAAASRANTDAIFELYARVIVSQRESAGGFKQAFQFGDLFTDKPPYLSGTYSLWKGVDLWNVDSKPFLGEKGKGKMARVMGRIKRCEQGGGCEMVVLSIWEVDWEDVDVAKGIVCS